MNKRQFSDETLSRLSKDIELKLREKRAMLEGSEGRITLELFPKGANFDIKVNVTG